MNTANTGVYGDTHVRAITLGRKSRIARGLDIGAAARKMLEKAIGVALTDEEYWDLEHGKLTVDEILETRQARLVSLSQKEWWMPYVKPLPTWV